MKSEFTKASVAVAIGCWLAFLTGPNAMIASTNGNFLNVLPEALGTTRTGVSSALAISVWLVGLVLPITGRLMDRVGIRAVIIPGLIMFAVVHVLLGMMTQLWHFFALQIALAFVVTACNAVGYAKIISMWFDRNRGVVLGICVAFGAGLGQTIMPKLSQHFIEMGGYRGGYWLIAGLIAFVGLPSVFLLVRPPKQGEGPYSSFMTGSGAPSASGAAEPVEVEEAEKVKYGLLLSEALRTRELPLIFVAIALASMSLLGTLQQAVPMLTDRGVMIDNATTVMSLIFAGVVAGEFSAGFIVDRLNTPRVVVPYFLCAILGLSVIHHSTNPVLLMATAPLMGLGLGCEIGLNAYLISRYFGLRSFGTLYGLTLGASNLGIGFGIIAMGYVRDTTGSYDLMSTILPITMSLSLVCMLFLGKFRFAPRR